MPSSVRPEIESIKDLKGKTVATELGTVDHLLLLTALGENGMNEEDINYVNMTVNDAGPAFISRQNGCIGPMGAFPDDSGEGRQGQSAVFLLEDTPGLIPDLLVFRERWSEAGPLTCRRSWMPGSMR